MFNKYMNVNRMKNLKKTHEEKCSRLIAHLSSLFVLLFVSLRCIHMKDRKQQLFYDRTKELIKSKGRKNAYRKPRDKKKKRNTNTHLFSICTSIAPISSSRIPLQTCICVNTKPNEEWVARKWSLNTKMTKCSEFFFVYDCDSCKFGCIQ